MRIVGGYDVITQIQLLIYDVVTTETEFHI